MSAGVLDVSVNADTLPDAPVALLERAVLVTLREEGIEEADISVTLLADGDMLRLNERWLGRGDATDVLAFSLGGEGATVGDVYVGHEQAARQAVELGVDPEEELVRLAIHGTLHVLGHDHPEGPEREGSPMFRRQEALVRTVLGGGRAG